MKYREVLFCFLFLFISFRVHGGYTGLFEVSNKIADEMDKALEEEFSKPNQWGYKVQHFWPNNMHGLTYSLSPSVDVYRFQYQDVDSATKIFTGIFKNLINRVNNNLREFRPFFAHFPITAHNINCPLGFNDIHMRPLPYPYIVATTFSHNIKGEGVLQIRQIDQQDVAKTILSLKAEEVDGLPELFDIKVPRKQCIKKLKIPVLTRLSSMQQTPVSLAEFEFAKKLCKKHNLVFLIHGSVGVEYLTTYPIEFAMRGSQELNLEQARLLASKCAKSIFEFARTNKQVSTWMKERSQNPKLKDPEAVFQPRHQAFRISFWDENIDRVPPGYIAEIRVEGESFKYYTSDDYQRLQLVHEEQFDDAMKLLKER